MNCCTTPVCRSASVTTSRVGVVETAVCTTSDVVTPNLYTVKCLLGSVPERQGLQVQVQVQVTGCSTTGRVGTAEIRQRYNDATPNKQLRGFFTFGRCNNFTPSRLRSGSQSLVCSLERRKLFSTCRATTRRSTAVSLLGIAVRVQALRLPVVCRLDLSFTCPPLNAK